MEILVFVSVCILIIGVFTYPKWSYKKWYERCEELVLREKYKKYCNGELKIQKVVSPDHLADCLEEGRVKKLKFASGNVYQMRFLKAIRDKKCPELFDGVYEMSNDIQYLTFEQFVSLY